MYNSKYKNIKYQLSLLKNTPPPKVAQILLKGLPKDLHHCQLTQGQQQQSKVDVKREGIPQPLRRSSFECLPL